MSADSWSFMVSPPMAAAKIDLDVEDQARTVGVEVGDGPAVLSERPHDGVHAVDGLLGAGDPRRGHDTTV